MEDLFKKLQQNKQNSVDNLIKWMKDYMYFLQYVPSDNSSRRFSVVEKLISHVTAKIVEGKKVSEDKAKQMFEDVSDASNVQFAKFKDVLGNLAREQKKSVGEFCTTLAEGGAKFFKEAMATASTAASAAANTVKDVLKKN